LQKQYRESRLQTYTKSNKLLAFLLILLSTSMLFSHFQLIGVTLAGIEDKPLMLTSLLSSFNPSYFTNVVEASSSSEEIIASKSYVGKVCWFIYHNINPELGGWKEITGEHNGEWITIERSSFNLPPTMIEWADASGISVIYDVAARFRKRGNWDSDNYEGFRVRLLEDGVVVKGPTDYTSPSDDVIFFDYRDLSGKQGKTYELQLQVFNLDKRGIWPFQWWEKVEYQAWMDKNTNMENQLWLIASGGKHYRHAFSFTITSNQYEKLVKGVVKFFLNDRIAWPSPYTSPWGSKHSYSESPLQVVLDLDEGNPFGSGVVLGEVTEIGWYSFDVGRDLLRPGSHSIWFRIKGNKVTNMGYEVSSSSMTLITAEAFDFAVSASPSSRTITAGQSTTYTITVTLTSGSTQPVSLSVSGLPSGSTGNFNPNSGNPTFTSTLTITTNPNTPTGTYTLTITGTGGGKSKNTQVTLVVTMPVEAAQIISITTDKTQYSISETVSIPFTIKNTGNVRLHLRMVVNIEDPNGVIVYDSHKTSPIQDKEYWLDPGQQKSDSFQWTIPSGAPSGTYKIYASLRNWDDWNKIYDYRWGDKPGPTFKVILPDLTITSVKVYQSEVQAGGKITVEFTEKNQGTADSSLFNTGIYLGKTEYGTNYNLGVGERHSLKAGESRTFKYEVYIPKDAPPGEYYVTVFIDYTNEVKESNENNNIGSTTPSKVTVHERRFLADHASFEVWFPPLQPPPHAVYFKLDYRNDLTEDVIVVFYVKDADGNIISATTWHRLFGNSIAKAGATGTVHAEWIAQAGTYYFSWKAYLISDDKFAKPIDGSTQAEERTLTLMYIEGMGPLSHSLSNFKDKSGRQYSVKGFLPIQVYRYSVEPKVSNMLLIDFSDTFPYVLAPLYPTKLNPTRYLYIFIPSSVLIESYSIAGKIELVKTYMTSEELGTWYVFKLTADQKVAWLEWKGTVVFKIKNPTVTSSIVVMLSSIPEIISENILDTATNKLYEFIVAKLTGGAWFSPMDLLTFLVSIGSDILSSHQMIILDTGIQPSLMEIHPILWDDVIEAGKSKSQIFTVSAFIGTVKGVTVTKVSGPDWITVSPTNLGDIPAGSSKTFTVTASPPAGTTGSFNYLIRVTCTEGEPKSIDISGTITVTLPPVGKLIVNIHNYGNLPLPKDGGSIRVLVFTSDLSKSLERIVSYKGGEGYVTAEFDVTSGDYVVFVDRMPSGGLGFVEYWGELSVKSPGIYDFYRHTQVITDVNVNKDIVSIGESVEISVKVKNIEPSNQKRLCEYIGTRVKLILDRDKAEPWDYEVYFPMAPPSIKIPYDGGVENFLFTYTPKNPGTYYLYVLSEGNYYNIMGKAVFEGTDQYGWVKAFTVTSPTDTVPPSVKVISPNGGETWNVGETRTITWTASDNVGVNKVDISYSTDGGKSWITIATNLPNTGSYQWKIPSTPSTNCLIRIEAYDSAGNKGSDISDGTFTITSTSLNKGDLDNNGAIDAVDLVLMKKIILGIKPPVDFNHDGKIDDTDYTLMRQAADMNDDGKVDAIDLVLLKKVLLKS